MAHTTINDTEIDLKGVLEWLNKHTHAIALILLFIMIVMFFALAWKFGGYIEFIGTEPCNACEAIKGMKCINVSTNTLSVPIIDLTPIINIT